MKRKNEKKKIVLLILLIIALIMGGVLVIDITSRLVGFNLEIPIFSKFKANALKKIVQKSENVYLLEREELEKMQKRIDIKEETVLNRESEVKSRELQMTKLLESIAERERELEVRATMLDDRDKQFMDHKKNIREQAEKLYNMPPNDAATILEQLDEPDVVEILRAIDAYSEEIGSSSTAPYLLKLINDLNKVKAAGILSKLKYDPGDSYSGVDLLDDENIEVPPAP